MFQVVFGQHRVEKFVSMRRRYCQSGSFGQRKHRS